MTQPDPIGIGRPNAGRIYDYLLGGHHNFEIDRTVGDQIRQAVPFLPAVFRLQRWCLQDLARELTEKRGFDVLVDFASGLPTQDNLHSVVPATTEVIYSDSDPVVVNYAQKILTGIPNVHYFQGDAGMPEQLLGRPEVQTILGERRDVGLVYWGISIFLSDDAIAHAASVLYDWAGPGSCLAFLAQGAIQGDNPQAQRVQALYARTGTPIYFRPLERFQELLQPWHPDERGFINLLDWHGIEANPMTPEERAAYGGIGISGAYLVK